jgi:branched-chain amino acid transport system substrate-binding protein
LDRNGSLILREEHPTQETRVKVLRFLFALLVAAFSAAGALAADPIRIGAVLSVTGASSSLGDPEAKTLQMYVDQINASGGVLGRKLELVMYDDGSDANKARTLATRLAEQDNVAVLIGGSTTGSTMAMVPVVESAELPFMSLGGAVVIVEPVRKWVFKSPHTDRMGCERIFADMKKRNITRVALLAGTDGFGISMREQCVRIVGGYGIQIVVEQTYGVADVDMTPQLIKIRNTPGVQAILNTSAQGDAVITRNHEQLGMKRIALYMSHASASKTYIQLAGSAAEGVRLPAAALLVAGKLPMGDPQRPVVLAYTEKFEKTAHQPANAFGGSAYDALMMVVAAIGKANSAEPAKIRDALERTIGFVGTAGIVNMSARDHVGLTAEAFRMVEVRGGDWALVD